MKRLFASWPLLALKRYLNFAKMLPVRQKRLADSEFVYFHVVRDVLGCMHMVMRD